MWLKPTSGGGMGEDVFAGSDGLLLGDSEGLSEMQMDGQARWWLSNTDAHFDI